MDTDNKNQRTLLSLALIASLSATALFVASAEEKPASDDTVPVAATALPGDAQAMPVIELPTTTTLAGDPTVDAGKAMSEDAPLDPAHYTWHPRASPPRAAVILALFPRQQIHVY